MNKTLRTTSNYISIVLALLPLVSASATTTPDTPYRSDAVLAKVYQTLSVSEGREELEKIPSVTVKSRVRNVGFIDARFSIRRNKTWTSSVHLHGKELPDSQSPVLLQGSLAVGGAWKKNGRRIFPSAASIVGNTLKVTFPGRATGSKGTRQRVYTITMRLDGSLRVRASVASLPRSAGRRGACGAAVGIGSLANHTHGLQEHSELSDERRVIHSLDGISSLPSSTMSRVITISTDADEEWFQRYGEQSNAVIATIINSAEVIYAHQLGVRFRIVQQHVYAQGSPYVTTDPSKLLAAFAMNQQNRINLGNNQPSFHNDVDLKHLFTGKDLDGTTIGIAYVGAVCALPSMAYGITQAYMDIANPAVFAHELGHNLGATHDASAPRGLMYPAISLPPAQGFSDTSLNQIEMHLTRYGTCISLEELAPLPNPPRIGDTTDQEILNSTPASLTLHRREISLDHKTVVKLSGVLLSRAAKPMKAVAIVLMAQGQEVARAVTNTNGRYSFLIRVTIPKGKTISMQAQAEGSVVASNELLFSRRVDA